MNCVEIERTAKGCGFMVARAVDESRPLPPPAAHHGSIVVCCRCGTIGVVEGDLHHSIDGERKRYTAAELWKLADEGRLPEGLEVEVTQVT